MTGPVDQDDAERTFTTEQLAALVPPSRRPDLQSAGGKVTPEQVEAALFPQEDSTKRVRIICPDCREEWLISVEDAELLVFCVKCGARVTKKVVDVEEEARAQTRELFPGAFNRLFDSDEEADDADDEGSDEEADDADDEGLEEFTTLLDRKEDDDTIEEPIAEVTVRILAMQDDVAEEVPKASVVVQSDATVQEAPAIIHESFVAGVEPLPEADVSILRARTEEIVRVDVPMPEELFNSDMLEFAEPPGPLALESLPELYLDWTEQSVLEASALAAEPDEGEEPPLLISDRESIEHFKASLLAALAADEAASLRRESELAVAESDAEAELVATPEPEEEPELPVEAIIEGEASKPQGYRWVPYLSVVIGISVVLGSLTYYLAKYFAG